MSRGCRSIAPTLGGALWLALLAAGGVEAAEPHPILARGFEADQVYDFNDIDHVNAFNGNLVVTIPIGQRYPLNAGFEYGFTLVYNSRVWEYVHDCPDDGKDEFGDGTTLNLIDPFLTGCIRGLPNPRSNAGTSWRLSLGELYDPDGPLASTRWVFVDSSGAERRFISTDGVVNDVFPKFTRDSSYLRLRQTNAAETPACTGVSGTCMAVEHPDGVVYAFESASNTLARWRLHRIQDPFGNWVEVVYSGSQWLVDDSQGRRHTISFDAAGMVLSASLAGFGSTTADYGFTTVDSDPIVPGCPHDFDVDGQSERETLHLLTEVTQPDGSSYTFTYAPDDGFDEGCTREAGRLQTLGLPTGGSIEYEYGGFVYPVHGSPTACDRPPVRDGNEPKIFTAVTGVQRRVTRGRGGNSLGETRYLSGGVLVRPRNVVITLSDGSTSTKCVVPPTTFTEVYEESDQGRYKLTRHFFDITGAFDYGLPRDQASADSRNSNRFRSSMVFDCAAPDEVLADGWVDICNAEDETGCWQPDQAHLWVPPACNDGVAFNFPEDVQGLRDSYLEHEAGGVNGTDNRRVRSENVYFYDSEDNYHVETLRSDFDGFGHYRTTTTRSNSPRSVERTVEVAYRSEVTDDLWLLELFDKRTVTEDSGGTKRTSEESFEFDRTTGFLEKKTTHRSGGNLVSTFTDDGSGNVATESYTIGDFGAPDYVIENEYDNGTLSSSQYVRDNRTILRTVDATIDASTGLPSASRDASGLETKFTFDALGRLTRTAQQGTLAEAATDYTYKVANPGRASVTITRSDTKSEIFFDGLGRVNEERNTLPGGVVNRRFTTFTPQGQPDTVTTLHDNADRTGVQRTRTDYDVFGRPTRIFHPDDGSSTGRSQTFLFYDGIFKTIREIQNVQTPEGPLKFRVNLHRDHQGRLVQVEELKREPEPLEVRLRTKYSYDEGGRLIRVNQGGGTQIRTFDYDGAGLLLKECHPELGGGCIDYGAFDARGNPGELRYSRAGGEPFELDYTYDGAERLTQIRSAQDGRILKEFFYENLYGGSFTPADGNGKLFQSKRHNYLDGRDVVATTTHTYAGTGGRLSRRTVTTGGDGDVPRVRFTTDLAYDSLGNLSRITYPTCDQVGCAGQPPARTVARAYTRGLLTGVGVPANTNRYATLTYHPNQTLHRVTHGNGVVDDHAQDPSQMQRPGGVEVRTGSSPGVGTLWEATYGYDGAGNLVSRDSRGLDNSGSLLFDGTDLFRYDNAFNRLVSATIHYPEGSSSAVESRDYGYDLFGNIASISGSNPRNLSPDGTTNRLLNPFTYDEAGNLTSQPGWDGLGNPTGPAEWFYAYDPFNMMTLAQKVGGSVVRRYVYTADDERLAILPDNGRELWTVRGPDDRVLRDVEYLSTGWGWVEDYIHRGAGLLATIEDVGGVQHERHHHLDHLGTPRLVTNSSGQVLARHVHAPYGEELTPENQNELRMKFTGHERDDLDSFGEAGDLDYMHARHHSPQLGRFLSIDPARGEPRIPGTWNRYGYVLARPLSLIDLDGKQPSPATSMKLAILFKKILPNTGDFRLKPSFGSGKKVGFGVRGIIGVTADITHTFDKPGTHPEAGQVTFSLQYINGIFVTIGSEGFAPTTEDFGFLFGPAKKSLLSDAGTIPGPSEAEGSVVFGPFHLGVETEGLDGAVSEAFRIIFSSSLEDTLAEAILLEASERGDLDGFAVVHGELIRVEKE